jgi:hypothetical protein
METSKKRTVATGNKNIIVIFKMSTRAQWEFSPPVASNQMLVTESETRGRFKIFFELHRSNFLNETAKVD